MPHNSLPNRPRWHNQACREVERLWLDKNESAEPRLNQLIQKIVTTLPPRTYASYPELGPLYHKLAAHLDVSPEQLILTPGSDGAIRQTFQLFVKPGDVVMHTAPTFAMYSVYSQIFGAKAVTVEYQPSPNGPILEAATLIEQLQAVKPTLFCLPNPDSPSGTVVAPEVLQELIGIAANQDTLCLIDEAYYPFYTESVLPLIAQYDNLIVTRTTGKAWGMAGFRIGYAIGQPERIEPYHRARSMYEINTVGAAVLERLLNHTDAITSSVAALEAGKSHFQEQMRDLGFISPASHGNFCHVGFAAAQERVHQALKDHVYYRQHTPHPALADFSRFSSATIEQFAPIIERIKAAI